MLKSIRRKNGRKTLGQGKTYLTTKIWQLSSDFPRLTKMFLPCLSSLLKMAAYCSRFVPGTKCCVMHQSIPAAPQPPPPPPGRLRGICQPQGHSRAFDMDAVSYQNITTQRILLGKKADWLICQGQEKIEEGCRGMFLILCISSLLIKPELPGRITERNRELST